MSTYTDSLGLEEITPGDQAGLWGNTTNNNLALIDQAVTGVTPISFTGLSGTVRTLDAANGALDEARAAVLNITGIATGPNTVVVPNRQKTYLVRNNTGQDVVFRTASPSATYSVNAGNSILVFCDGDNGVFTGIASPSVGTLSVSAGGTGQTSFGGGGFVISSGGTNSLTTQAAVGIGGTATNQTLGQLQVANGGTGLTTIPAGAILRGAGTSAPAAVTGSTGQVLTWNNSQWEAATPAAAAVTSIVAGTGISVSSPTGAVTVTNTGPTLSSTNTWTGANSFTNSSGAGTPIFGSTNNSGAASGYVGQTITASGSNIPLVSGATAVIATLSLPAGDWDIFGGVNCNFGNLNSFICGVNATTTLAGSTGIFGGTFGPISLPIPFTPTIVGSTTPFYLLANVGFSSGSPVAGGSIFARRIR
jgi:hypothetical protein